MDTARSRTGARRETHRSALAADAKPPGGGDTNIPVESGTERSLDLRQQAVERVKKKRDFKTHLFVYVCVNAMLVAIWALTSDDGLFWPIFPMLGWGIGVAANAWEVYGRKPITEAEIRREEQRLRQ